MMFIIVQQSLHCKCIEYVRSGIAGRATVFSLIPQIHKSFFSTQIHCFEIRAVLKDIRIYLSRNEVYILILKLIFRIFFAEAIVLPTYFSFCYTLLIKDIQNVFVLAKYQTNKKRITRKFCSKSNRKYLPTLHTWLWKSKSCNCKVCIHHVPFIVQIIEMLQDIA